MRIDHAAAMSEEPGFRGSNGSFRSLARLLSCSLSLLLAAMQNIRNTADDNNYVDADDDDDDYDAADADDDVKRRSDGRYLCTSTYFYIHGGSGSCTSWPGQGQAWHAHGMSPPMHVHTYMYIQNTSSSFAGLLVSSRLSRLPRRPISVIRRVQGG